MTSASAPDHPSPSSTDLPIHQPPVDDHDDLRLNQEAVTSEEQLYDLDLPWVAGANNDRNIFPNDAVDIRFLFFDKIPVVVEVPPV